MTGNLKCSESASIYSIEECRFIDALTDRELRDPRGGGLALKWLTPNHVTSQVNHVIIAKTIKLRG